ncbi:MAG TPA: hypothetical protein VFE24_13940 [Pirellulales bacterium]|jgi:hypothetical protein|nr:hypothetical protein [Pirellulales bacterium]
MSRFSLRRPWTPSGRLAAALALFMGVAVTRAKQLHAAEPQPKLGPYAAPLRLETPPLAGDNSVRYDYDIIYVRAPRTAPDGKASFAEVGDPRTMEPGADLMLLHPNGQEEVLVAVRPEESIADPSVSFDGKTVFFAKMHDAKKHKGADLYKIDVATRAITQLTSQTFTPNTGVADWSKTKLPDWGVYNLGPYPLPGHRLVFVSDRNAYRAVNPGYAPHALALQLFTMDQDGGNVDCIGHLNLGSALHPVVLKDGRIMFSSLESQGLRSHHLWGVWAIHPDGTAWEPLYSAFEVGNGTANSTHFQAQLSDQSIVVESYYNLNNFGFGTYYKFPISPPDGYAQFGPGYKPLNVKLRHGRNGEGRANFEQHPFNPTGIESLTPFVVKGDWPSEPSILKDDKSPRVGKFTHPASAPDNCLLTAWSPGSLNSYARYTPAFDSGIYLIKGGQPIDEPAQMRLIKNDPRYHEQWPRALVPYRRIYGVDEPRNLPRLANDGSVSAELPAGTPFGLVGTSSLYKRESYPYGAVPKGSVTATFAGKSDPFHQRGFDTSFNWNVQGADAGLYANDDIHAIRIVLLEPTTETGAKGGRRFYNHAKERMRILGEIPVRKFHTGEQPRDPDGNPDTSFLAKIPADVAWAFQTLDKNGMVLNMAQTWHQVRPGEMRTNCGGCHAHSQQPTRFELTAAARADYRPFDLTERTSLLTTKSHDESGQKWDAQDETGVRYEPHVKNVEFFRDVQPLLARSCYACHTSQAAHAPGELVLDDESWGQTHNPSGLGFELSLPNNYLRLAADSAGKYGFKPLNRNGWTDQLASRYVRMLQSRRSLLIWKIYGRRLDGWTNEDAPYEATPGDPSTLTFGGKSLPDTPQNREHAQLAFTGSRMPPPDAIKEAKVPPLSDEDRMTLVRWIDLGCPIDLDYDRAHPEKTGNGWLCDDLRPTLALTCARAGEKHEIDRILVGMYDYGSGIDPASFEFIADFDLDGGRAGENLAKHFQPASPGVLEWKLAQPLANLPQGKLRVAIQDRQGNRSEVERRFAIP